MGGANHTGYASGNEPVKGSLGTAEVSRFGVANAGQFNIVNQEESRKPIVFLGRGTKGKVAIMIYPFAGLTEKVTYTINHEKRYIIQHTGPALGVYLLQ